MCVYPVAFLDVSCERRAATGTDGFGAAPFGMSSDRATYGATSSFA